MKITFFSSTNEVLLELGSRIKAARIAMSITQKGMAARTNLSQKTISNLENGRDVSLTTVIEVLRALGQLQGLDVVIPEQGISPSQIAALGKQRERVSSKAKAESQAHSDWKWGDEK